MKMDKEKTQELIDKFDKECENYIADEIDTDMLKKGLVEVVDNWS